MILVAGLIAVIAPITAMAQQAPGPHPAYMHALSNLRAARHYLNDRWAWEPVRREVDGAVHEIDMAIQDIQAAAIDDGVPLNGPYVIDPHLSPRDRFKKAAELLGVAHEDLRMSEDVPQSRGLRDRATARVDQARRIVVDADRTGRWQ
jgi:hypothetical protein